MSPVDSNGNWYTSIDNGLAYEIVVGYIDDSDIQVTEGENISVYKCYIPEMSYDDISLFYNLNDYIELPGNTFVWEQGSLNTTNGSTTNSDYYIRTSDYIKIEPNRKLLYTGAVTSTVSGSVYFYDSNLTFLYRTSFFDSTEPIIIPYGASYLKMTYGNSTASGIKVTNGVELLNTFKLTIYNTSFKDYLERIGYLEFNLDKGYWRENGTINPNTTGICSSTLFQFPVGKVIKVIIREPNWVYSVMEGDTATDLKFSYRLINYSEFEIKGAYTGFMFYKKDLNGDYVNLTVDDFNNAVSFFVSGYEVNIDVFNHDVPRNIGVLNVINRSYQMAKLTYSPVDNLPTQVNTSAYPNYVPEGTKVTGVMYSSVRNEGLYVPQCVSFDSYMTSLLNPNSYIYTKTEPSPHYNALTYYGAVCSSMVAYCFGIEDVIPTTVSFDTYPGMEIVEDQSPYGLELGCVLNKSANHIIIVTDIARNSRGVIQYVELTEQVNYSSHPMTRRTQRSPEYIQQNLLNNGYVIYTYHYIYKVPYTASPWINLDDETEQPAYNINLSPRRGENANWRPGETIEIDITDPSSYTYANLYKDDVFDSQISIDGSSLLTYSNLTYGSYKVCLTDGSNVSPFVYFDIIDSSVSCTVLGNSQLRVYYQSSNGTPSSISFCEADINDTDYKAVLAFHVLSSEEIADGNCVITAPSSGQYLIKVMFKTTFGLYSSDFVTVNVE